MLSNLLDNAIEAQTFVDNKRVEVFIDENEDVCSLKYITAYQMIW